MALLATTVLVPTLLAVPASAEPKSLAIPSSFGGIVDPVPGGFANWGELFELQGQMNIAAAEITATADRLAAPGFGAAIAAPENRQLKIYWWGKVPTEVQSVIDYQRTIVPIVVLSAKYTQKELLRAAAALAKHSEYVEVGPLPDASGLQVRTAVGRAVSIEAQAARVDDVDAHATKPGLAVITHHKPGCPHHLILQLEV